MLKEKLKEALEFAKENGLKTVSVDGIVFEVTTAEVQTTEQSEDDLKKALDVAVTDDLTEEENLYYATPYFDVLMAERQRKQEARTMDEQVKEDKNG